MKLTMVWEATTDEEETQLGDLSERIRIAGIGRVTMVQASGTIEAVEDEGATLADADYYRYARLVKILLTTPTRMGGLIPVQDVILLLAEEFKIGEES